MIAAIYCRKSNEQDDRDEEQKSVARQRENAGLFIEKQGWTLAPDSTFVDDGISGAEFLKRPGLARLLNSLKPRPRFDVLVVMQTDRFGREMIESPYVNKNIIDAGVRLFEYTNGNEVKLDNAIDDVMLSLKGYAAEVEREQATIRALDSGVRKCLRGEATGPACYGYRSVNVLRDGSRTLEPVAAELRSHVVHEIDPPEAEVIKRIFELTRDGLGWKRIAKSLNLEGTKSATRLKWDGAMIGHSLNRESYHGVTSYGKAKRGHKSGTAKTSRRAEALATLQREDLRIVSEELWQAAQSARQSREAKQLRDAGGKLAGHPSLS
jgi:DNA invertase Pin-like site-specific DNA recombinase